MFHFTLIGLLTERMALDPPQRPLPCVLLALEHNQPSRKKPRLRLSNAFVNMEKPPLLVLATKLPSIAELLAAPEPQSNVLPPLLIRETLRPVVADDLVPRTHYQTRNKLLDIKDPRSSIFAHH